VRFKVLLVCVLLLLGTGSPVRAASRTTAFALVYAGPGPGWALVAKARRIQPGGPETVTPVDVQRPAETPIDPGADITITAPLYAGELRDWLAGAEVDPGEFDRQLREADRRYGPLPDRARMFDVTFDDLGRIVRLHHIFSP
jgi:hypothetical protein